MEYTDRHRTFLQAIIGQGCMEVAQALQLLNAINEKYEVDAVNEEVLHTFICEINEKIALFDQRIKRVKHDIVRKDFIVFANTIEDEINMKLSYAGSAQDREYFRILLQELTLNSYRLQRMVALNLTSEVKPRTISKNHAEELIDEWISVGYLLEHDNLLYYGARTLGEFSEYLAEHFSDYVKKCHLCMAAVLMGTTCDDCEEIFHRDCLRKAFSKSLNCPKCKVPWKKPI